LGALTPSYASDFKIVFLTPEEIGAVVLLAGFLGLLGAWWAVGRELRRFSIQPGNLRAD
jgi:cell division protein FtsX